MKSSKTIINEYLHKSDWRVKENSTVSYSIGGLILSNSGNVTSDYWLSEVYDKEIADAHRNADIHLHDLSMLSGYCFTGDTRIKTLNGANPTFEELVKAGDTVVWVYAFDLQKNKIVPAEAVFPRQTRTTNELVEIAISNGKTIRCTPDHPFLTEEGVYIPAKDIAKNTALKYVGLIPKVVVDVSFITLEKPIPVYDITVPEYHNFLLADDVFVHNCAGWSLKQLIQEGLGGVPGRITSAPAKHLSTLCNQMANFLGIMQNEWAGAQAFSSFDTYLAPFVKVDNLSYKEVKQCLQSLIFHLNTPARWGCLSTTTKVLTRDGWKGPDELKIGDPIFTWYDGVLMEAPLRHIIRRKNDYSVLHRYKGINYVQTVSPEHRCIVESDTKRGSYVIKQSMDIFTDKKIIRMPLSVDGLYLGDGDNSMDDAEIRAAAQYYADLKHGIPEKYKHLSTDQSELFLIVFSAAQGNTSEHIMCQYEDEETADALSIIALRAGNFSYRKTNGDKHYVVADLKRAVTITEREEIPYTGEVWCPNTAVGTAIYKDEDGNIFISGNCQAPFTNITLDWTVPNDLAELNCIVGGKEMDFKYKDCKKEMDMINKAFIEIMIEGDANGRGFQYPINWVA